METVDALYVRKWDCPHHDCLFASKSLQGMKKHLVKMHNYHPGEWD